MAHEDPGEREAMLAWLPRLAESPSGVATAALPRPGVPAFTASVPGTDAWVDYIVVDQYQTIMILGVSDLGPDDLPPS